MKYLKRFENLEENAIRDLEDDHLIVKDIVRDLEDEHEISFDTYIGKFFNEDPSVRTLWGYVPVRGGIHANSININLGLLALDRSIDSDDLEGCKYFIFNKEILPTINTIKSHLEEVNIVIVKINRVASQAPSQFSDLFYDSSKNDYYILDEFIKEHGSEEFNELEIILY
jgi:hypothetical protein